RAGLEHARAVGRNLQTRVLHRDGRSRGQRVGQEQLAGFYVCRTGVGVGAAQGHGSGAYLLECGGAAAGNDAAVGGRGAVSTGGQLERVEVDVPTARPAAGEGADGFVGSGDVELNAGDVGEADRGEIADAVA